MTKGFRWPFVARSTFELVQADRDWFREQYVKLTTPPEPKKPVFMPGHAVSDEQAVSQAERNFIARLRDDLVKQGVHPSDAEKEAARIRRETTVTTIGV